MLRYDARAIILLAASYSPAAAQDTRQEVRPELEVYLNNGSRVRFLFQSTFEEGTGNYSQGRFGYFVDVALRPLFRRNLRNQPDVFRNRYLTFRVGYQYGTSLLGGGPHENRFISELTARYPLPGGFVLRDRNRGELRFVQRQDYSTRYRNRLWLERDFKLDSIAFTPYAYDEIFYDTRYDDWSRNRIAAGVQFPIADRLVVEPYLLRQINYQGSTRRIHAAGLKLSLFF